MYLFVVELILGIAMIGLATALVLA